MVSLHYDIDENLREVFHLDRLTLEANAAGHMTDVQRQQVRDLRLRKVFRHGVPLTIIMIAFGFVITSPPGGISVPDYGFMLLMLGALGLWQGGQIVRYWLQISREAARGIVHHQAGPVSKLNVMGLRTLFCGRTRFIGLSNAEWKAFRDGRPYELYFTPRTHLVIAARSIDPDEALPDSWG